MSEQEQAERDNKASRRAEPPHPHAVELEPGELWALPDGEGGVDFFDDAGCTEASDRTGISVRWWGALDRLRAAITKAEGTT